MSITQAGKGTPAARRRWLTLAVVTAVLVAGAGMWFARWQPHGLIIAGDSDAPASPDSGLAGWTATGDSLDDRWLLRRAERAWAEELPVHPRAQRTPDSRYHHADGDHAAGRRRIGDGHRSRVRRRGGDPPVGGEHR